LECIAAIEEEYAMSLQPPHGDSIASECGANKVTLEETCTAILEEPASEMSTMSDATANESTTEIDEASEAEELSIPSLPLLSSEALQGEASFLEGQVSFLEGQASFLGSSFMALQQQRKPSQKRICHGVLSAESSMSHLFVDGKATQGLQQELPTERGLYRAISKRKRVDSDADDDWQRFNEDLFLDAGETLAEAGLTFEVVER